MTQAHQQSTGDDTKKQGKPTQAQEAKENDASNLEQKIAEAIAEDENYKTLEGKITELTAQLQTMKEFAARAQADLQNAKVRQEREAVEIRTFAAEGVLRKLIPTVDNFDRALSHLPVDIAGHEWVKGVVSLEGALKKELASLGLQKFSPLGEVVDTVKHEVLMNVPGEAGKIAQVFEDGYTLNGRVLRPAKVGVGDGSPIK